MRPLLHNSVERMIFWGLPLPILTMAVFALARYGRGEYRDVLAWPMAVIGISWLVWLGIGFPIRVGKLPEVPARVPGFTLMNIIAYAAYALAIYSFTLKEVYPHDWSEVAKELLLGGGMAVAMHLYFSFQIIEAEQKRRVV